MGAAIVATNAPALGARIRDLRAVLDGWLAELERPGGPDEAAVRDRLAAARASLDELGVSDEQVYIVPRAAVPTRPAGTGCGRTGWTRSWRPWNATAGMSRATAMERDPSCKQVIPYLVLRDGAALLPDAADDRPAAMRGSTAATRSGSAATSTRATAGSSAGSRASGARSSSPTSCPTFQLVGLLNDDTTEVGAVHLGAVYVADAAGRPVAIRETDKLTGSFVEAAAVAAVADRLETWSRLVFDHLAVAGRYGACVAAEGGAYNRRRRGSDTLTRPSRQTCPTRRAPWRSDGGQDPRRR